MRLGMEVETYTEHGRCDGEDENEPQSWRRELTIEGDGSTHVETVQGETEDPTDDGDSDVDSLLRTLRRDLSP